MTNVLALIDGSTYAQSVCEHAAWAANRIAASVEILHVLGRRDTSSIPADYTGNLDADTRDTLLSELASLDEQKARLAHKRGRVILEQAKACLVAAGVAEVTPKLRNGDLLETVEEFEAGADLIVIGKRGEAADFAKLHLGSNLERVVRSSQKPVLVASRAFKPINRFLIAFDGGASSSKAVDHIVRSKLFAGLDCQLLNAGADTGDMRKRIDDAAALLSTAGYAVHAQILPGQADAVIAQVVETEGVDLLVMGAYGHSRIRHLIVGSTTVEMVRSCKIPILMLH